MGPDAGPPPTDLGCSSEIPCPRCHHVGHLAEPTGDQRDQYLGCVEHGEHGQCQREPRSTPGDQHGAQLVTGSGSSDVVDTEPRPHVFAVSHLGIGNNHDASTGQLSPPAQIDVVAAAVDARVESADRGEEAGADQQTGRRHGKDVGDGVVLLLVEFVHVDHVVPRCELVDLQAHVLEQRRLLPVDELRSGDADVRPERLGDHDPHRIGGEGDVVVTHEKECRGDVGFQHGVGGGAEPVRIAGIDDGRRRGDGPHPLVELNLAVAVAACIDDHDVEPGVVLRDQAVERLFEPVAGFVGDDHSGDRGRGRARFGGGSVGLR